MDVDGRSLSSGLESPPLGGLVAGVPENLGAASHECQPFAAVLLGRGDRAREPLVPRVPACSEALSPADAPVLGIGTPELSLHPLLLLMSALSAGHPVPIPGPLPSPLRRWFQLWTRLLSWACL